MKTPDLREIIELCQAKGVVRLRMGGFEIDFGAPVSPKIASEATLQPIPDSPPTRLDVQDRELLADMDLHQRMLDDPLGYEQQMIDSHLRTSQDVEKTRDF